MNELANETIKVSLEEKEDRINNRVQTQYPRNSGKQRYLIVKLQFDHQTGTFLLNQEVFSL